MSETTRIADQLRRAFQGDAWHGDSLLEILDGVAAAQAAARPLKHAHSIWEPVLHITTWDSVVLRRLNGETVEVSAEQNFPSVMDPSEGAWRRAVENAKRVHKELVEAVAAFPDARLSERVPGKLSEPDWHNVYYMLHGAAQHTLYHAGQIALLKKTA